MKQDKIILDAFGFISIFEKNGSYKMFREITFKLINESNYELPNGAMVLYHKKRGILYFKNDKMKIRIMTPEEYCFNFILNKTYLSKFIKKEVGFNIIIVQ